MVHKTIVSETAKQIPDASRTSPTPSQRCFVNVNVYNRPLRQDGAGSSQGFFLIALHINLHATHLLPLLDQITQCDLDHLVLSVIENEVSVQNSHRTLTKDLPWNRRTS